MDYRGGYLELLAECSVLNAKNKMLLAALEAFLAAMESDFHDLMLAKLQAKAAIAKAKGGE